MKVSREQAAENRERVLAVAAQLFRERGFDGVGVADIMKTAGLTHGGFYGQFASKEDLMAQASARAFGEGADWWAQLASAGDAQPMEQIVRSYLSTGHRDAPGQGCVVAALGADAARQAAPVRRAVSAGIAAAVAALSRWMPGRSKGAQREKALALYASMVGAMVLARVVDDAALSEEILQSVLRTLPASSAAKQG